MTKKNLLKLKSACVRAIKAHLKKGGTLLANDFYLPETAAAAGKNDKAKNCKCPVQLVCERGGHGGCANSVALSDTLKFNIHYDEMHAFINGFDKEKRRPEQHCEISRADYNQLYNLGLELRKRFKPLTKRQVNSIMGYEYV